MDQGALVEVPIDDGRRFVERFAADGNGVRAAFWVKTADEGLWFLYVATDLVDREGPAAAYGAVQRSLRKLEGSTVRSSEIRVIRATDPMAEDVVALMSRRSREAGAATRFTGNRLGGMDVDQAYVYPKSVYTFDAPRSMTREEISREIVRLMDRGPGGVEPSRIALMDGGRFLGVPISLHFGAQNALVALFLADGEAAPRVYRIDEIAAVA